MQRDDVVMLEPDDALVAKYLDIWARWMRCDALRIGYPARSAGFTGRGLAHFEDLEDEGRNAAAVVLERIINDMEPSERAAVHHVKLHSVYRMRDLPGTFARACDKIRRGLHAEGWA